MVEHTVKKDVFFLPDISGFSHFVNDTAVFHSKHIIKELIELIIDLAPDEMVLSEIEGDAVFFYAPKDAIDGETLIQHIENMYIQFHDHLKLFESKRICPCGACTTASNLNLKFIVRFGDLSIIDVQGQQKPYGKDVILAHRLMKNSIKSDAYMLLSGNGLDHLEQIQSQYNENLSWDELNDEYDNERVSYSYTDLDYLNSKIRTYKKESLKPPDIKPITGSGLIDMDIYDLYEIISNFNYRKLWNTDADYFEFEADRVNRLGEEHVCVIKKDRIDFNTIHAEFGENKLVYGELTRNAPLVKELYNFITLEKENGKTKVDVIIYIVSTSFIKKLILPLLRIGLKKNIKSLLANLEEISKKENPFSIQES